MEEIWDYSLDLVLRIIYEVELYEVFIVFLFVYEDIEVVLLRNK